MGKSHDHKILAVVPEKRRPMTKLTRVIKKVIYLAESATYDKISLESKSPSNKQAQNFIF